MFQFLDLVYEDVELLGGRSFQVETIARGMPAAGWPVRKAINLLKTRGLYPAMRFHLHADPRRRDAMALLNSYQV